MPNLNLMTIKTTRTQPNSGMLLPCGAERGMQVVLGCTAYPNLPQVVMVCTVYPNLPHVVMVCIAYPNLVWVVLCRFSRCLRAPTAPLSTGKTGIKKNWSFNFRFFFSLFESVRQPEQNDVKKSWDDLGGGGGACVSLTRKIPNFGS